MNFELTVVIMEDDPPELEDLNTQTSYFENLLPIPLTATCAIARQSLGFLKTKSDKVKQRGISQKSGVYLSYATGLFIEELAKRVLQTAKSNDQNIIKRQSIVETIIKEPRYRFAVPRLHNDELLTEFFRDENEMSKRVALSYVNNPIDLNIPFSQPYQRESHPNADEDVAQQEKDNIEAVVKALAISYQGYRQTVPAFLKLAKGKSK